MAGEHDLVAGIIGVQLGFVTPEDVLAAARDVMPGAQLSLIEVLETQGVLSTAQRLVLERLATRAVTDGGGAAKTLELFPAEARRLLAESSPPRATPVRPLPAREAVCVEPEGRYQLSPGGAPGAQHRHDTVFGRDVTWRTAASEADEGRLLAEARIVAHLDHPAVLPIFEVGRSTEGALYVVTQRVGQRTLQTALSGATLAERLRHVASVLTVTQCLAAAHERGVTHGTLTSGVVVLGDFGEVYVTGWGAAARFEPTSTAFAHQARVDLRSLGLLLLHVLTGTPSVDARADHGAPSDLLNVARRAASGGGDGLATTEDLARELKAWLDGRRMATHRYSPWQLLARFAEKNRPFVIAATCALLLLGSVTGFTLARMGQERDRARRFAQVFLDDVGKKLQALPGVEPLLERVTSRAIAHYQRTMELERAPIDERVRVARALARLAAISTELGRFEEATASVEFAWSLLETVRREAPDDAEALTVRGALLVTRARLAAAGNSTPRARALAREAVAVADEAVTRSEAALPAVDLAVRARLALAVVAEKAEAQQALARVVELSTAAAARAPEDVDALRLLSLGLAARATAAREASPESVQQLLTEAQAAARRATEAHPEDDELDMLLADRLVELAQASDVALDPAAAFSQFEEAKSLCTAVLRRAPGHVAARQTMVSVEVGLGHADEAWQLVRELEAQGNWAHPWAATLASVLSGHFDDAVRFGTRGERDASTTALLALAQALQNRPAEAAVQARALRGHWAEVRWPGGRLTSALEPFEGRHASASAAVALVRALDEGQGAEQAVEQFISALEAELAH